MSDQLIYILLGILDSLACLLLVLKTFMLPAWPYKYKILTYCVLSSISSYVVRMEFGLPRLDLPLQFLYCILFLRFFIHMKTHLSAFVAGTGFTMYINLQVIIYFVSSYFNIAGSDVITHNSGFSVYFIQVVSILITYCLCYAMFKFDLGFSFIVEPPHDFFKKENYTSSMNLILLAGIFISIVTIGLTIYLLYSSNYVGTITVTLVAFCLSHYFSRKGDYNDARSSIEAYSKRNKKS